MKKKIGFIGVAALDLVGMSSCANPEAEGVGGETSEAAMDVEERTFEPVSDIAEMVPEEYREQGSFTVSTNPDVPPIKFVDNEGEITGLNTDLLRAAGDVMD